jgi:hypothetical protein
MKVRYAPSDESVSEPDCGDKLLPPGSAAFPMIVKGGSPCATASGLGTVRVWFVLSSMPFTMAYSSSKNATSFVEPPGAPAAVPSPASDTIRLPGVKPSTTAAGAHASASSAVRRGGISAGSVKVGRSGSLLEVV